MAASLQDLLRRAGLPDYPLTPLSGGMIGQVVRAGPYVVKTHPHPPQGLFQAEARGLCALRQAGIRVPQVYWASPEGLVLEYLEPGEPDWESLARMLCALHRTRAPAYGWDDPVFLGSFALPTGTGEDWNRFWAERRMRPWLEVTWSKLGNLGPRIENTLSSPLPSEGPTLLHGDLWYGNVYFAQGGPALLDPSVWWGERAVDLAMMELFGGFPGEFWRCYRALYPIPPEIRRAIPAYQLYYLLAHVHFFGTSYLGAVERALEQVEQ
ncbi:MULTISPECIES: fructosamine kinase family protein [unclassified Meiothermus]|uniref:fructosamine kinase family protein n=1 Tax=unclassified Meiothermus TaxID=370471 RepID=UPI000D7C3DE6|nr:MULTISPECIES: fructosamine kinase family protein [unclassified Meiothermus]PZA08961.1 fructosamine kinase [Meiothermus sp. Pnk-1]RYM28643.1 fructosamine kinase [Meiothermus sp. PNK-Is4]